MDEKTLQDIMVKVRDSVLKGLRRGGIRRPGQRRLCRDATLQDVNDVGSGDFAYTVAGHVRHRFGPSETVVVLNTYNLGEGWFHNMIQWNGKFYDAECIEGVSGWKELPSVKNRKTSAIG